MQHRRPIRAASRIRYSLHARHLPLRRRAGEATWTMSSLTVARVSFQFGLKSIDRFLHLRLPAASQRLIEADDRKQPPNCLQRATPPSHPAVVLSYHNEIRTHLSLEKMRRSRAPSN
jgi:hypothetical protein